MSRALQTRLTKLEASRRPRNLRGALVVHPWDASEEEIDALADRALEGLPKNPSVRVVMVPDRAPSVEAWEAADYD